MAETMQFDLVSPEKKLLSVAASEVRIPGREGGLSAMPGHAPLMTTLRPGVIRVVSAEGEDDYAVTGGFAEISGEAATVLAERALHASEVTNEVLEEFMEEARRKHATAQESGEQGLVDDAATLMADMVAMGTHIGLDFKNQTL